MASKPASKKPGATLVVAKPKTAVAASLSSSLGAAVQRQREELAKMPSGGGKSLSFKGGRMKLDDVEIGNELPIIILASQFERSWYPLAYSVDGDGVPPSCYSRENGPAAKPDETAPFPQSKLCRECQWNEFETAHQGKGKACKEGVKIAFVHPANLSSANPPVVQAKFSVLNSQDILKDLKGVYAKGVEHTVQAHLTLTCHPDDKRIVKNSLLFEGFVPQEDVDKLTPLIDAAQETLVQAYPESKAVDPAEAKKSAAKPTRARKGY